MRRLTVLPCALPCVSLCVSASFCGREAIREANIKWAMIEMLKSPPAGFEEPIRIHFQKKKQYILDTVAGWLAEARRRKRGKDTAAHPKRLALLITQLRRELDKLPVDSAL